MIVCTVYLYIATFGANVRFCRIGREARREQVSGGRAVRSQHRPGVYPTAASRPMTPLRLDWPGNGCSPPLRMSISATFSVATSGREEPRRAAAGGAGGGQCVAVVVSLSRRRLPR